MRIRLAGTCCAASPHADEARAATVRVTRRFDAAPERVFDAWLAPAMVGRFMFGPQLRDEQVLRIEVDAQDQSRVDIEITPRDRGFELVLTHRMDPRWAEYADRVRAGWTTMCDALARALAA